MKRTELQREAIRLLLKHFLCANNNQTPLKEKTKAGSPPAKHAQKRRNILQMK